MLISMELTILYFEATDRNFKIMLWRLVFIFAKSGSLLFAKVHILKSVEYKFLGLDI